MFSFVDCYAIRTVETPTQCWSILCMGTCMSVPMETWKVSDLSAKRGTTPASALTEAFLDISGLSSICQSCPLLAARVVLFFFLSSLALNIRWCLGVTVGPVPCGFLTGAACHCSRDSVRACMDSLALLFGSQAKSTPQLFWETLTFPKSLL